MLSLSICDTQKAEDWTRDMWTPTCVLPLCKRGVAWASGWQKAWTGTLLLALLLPLLPEEWIANGLAALDPCRVHLAVGSTKTMQWCGAVHRASVASCPWGVRGKAWHGQLGCLPLPCAATQCLVQQLWELHRAVARFAPVDKHQAIVRGTCVWDIAHVSSWNEQGVGTSGLGQLVCRQLWAASVRVKIPRICISGKSPYLLWKLGCKTISTWAC